MSALGQSVQTLEVPLCHRKRSFNAIYRGCVTRLPNGPKYEGSKRLGYGWARYELQMGYKAKRPREVGVRYQAIRLGYWLRGQLWVMSLQT